MKEKDLKHRLQQTFDFSIWKEILPLFFKKIDYFSHPENVFPNDEKVIDGKQIGTVKLDDGKQLAIFTVEVADSISIVRNRQGLREIAAKYIDQNIIHGALAFFYNKNQADYRFSFIAKEASLDLETGELIKGETKPKRYTYLLGSNEACTTPAKRMLVLADKREKGEVNIKELKEVFSVEALNKDFFKSYKAHYEKFAKHLADEANPFRAKLIDTEKDTKDKEEKPIRDFVKKLLGRIVFLQFLEKKGWMGCDANSKEWTGGNPRFMYQLFEDFSKPEKFHSQCLTKLFFETLNTKRPNDIFEVQGLNGKLNGSRVPYLNGGLFEPEKNKSTLEVDFPADYFKDLLDFFDQYNFTIDENSPDDHEVGIDPEMLGHIFENLLEDNRDKGAFYTPKEIVQYMCKESLIQYLVNYESDKLRITNEEWKVAIEKFIRFHSVDTILANKEIALIVNQKLDDIKVCDPAIGSGAFPIGMLQEIFEAKRFIYPYLKTNKDFKPAEVKKNIIQNSIYGVDLEKGAVDIAQLRFWLSLVVDELNPHPLPNLDYKIMQGNSLLEQFQGIDLSKMGKTQSDVQIVEPIRDLFGNLTESQMKMTFSKSETINEIQKLIKQFFTIEVSEEKQAIRQKINGLVLQHIEYNIELRENQLNRFINEAGNYDNLNKNAKKKYDGYVADLAQIQDTKTQLLKIQETDERPYFLWHLYFMDVFEQGGFDVMIGNPPYIQLTKFENELEIYENSSFDTFTRSGDIYCLFYEKGVYLLKKNSGVLSYITSNSWMKTKYGEPLRKFFITQTNPIKLLNFEDTQLFPSATVEVNILISTRNNYKNFTESVALKQDSVNKTIFNYFEDNKVVLDNLDESEWIILSKSDFEIKKKIELGKSKVEDLNYYIVRGFTTGANEAFYFEEKIKQELISIDPNSDNVISPILRGRDLTKWKYSFNNFYSIIAKRGFEIEKYPAIKKHLQNHYEKLNSKSGNAPWYEFQANPSSDIFDAFLKPKIIWGELSNDAKFAFDNSGFSLDATVFLMTGEFLKTVLCIMNSKLGNWYFYQISTTSGMGTNRWKKYKIQKFPLPKISESINVPFETLAEYLIYLNDPKQAPILEKVSNEAISQVFEDLVNMMVYELYFEEEMKAKEIDVLQFVTEKTFPDITQAEDPKATIQKVYYELQQKDNPIRNRILVASSRSETIARINAATS